MVVVRKLQAVVEADGVSKFESDIAGAGSSLLSFKKTVGLTGGALAALGVGGFAVAVNEARKFQNSMIELEKVTSPETAEAMNESLLEMAETMPIAQSGLADIAADAGRFGVEGPEAIENFTESVGKMAVATNLSAQEAGEAFAKLAELTGTPIDEMENLGSAINALSNNFATSANEIVDNMLRSSAAMSQFGLSQTDIAGFAAAINEVSESSERAGTRLRRLVQEISNPKKIGDMARALGMNVEEYKRMQKNNPRQLLMQMIEGFREGGKTADTLNKNLSTTSRQALAGLSQNLGGLRDALGLSADAFKENTSLQSEFETASQTLDNQITLLLNSLRSVAIEIGSMLLPAITEVVKVIRGAVQTFSNLNDATDGILAPIGLLVMTIVGLTAAVTAFSGAISGMVGVVVAVGSALTTLALPITALTLGIIALHKAWTTNFAGIRTAVLDTLDVVTRTFSYIGSRISEIANLIRGDLTAAFSTGSGNIQQTVRQLVTTLKTAFLNWFINTFTPAVMNALNSIEQFWRQNRDTIISILKQLKSGLVTVMNAVVEVIMFAVNHFRRHWGTMQAIASKAIDVITRVVRHLSIVITDVFNNVIIPTLQKLQNFWRQHGEDIKLIINTLVAVGTAAFQFFTTVVLETINQFVGAAMIAWQKFGDEIMAVINFVADAVIAIIGTFVNAIATTIRLALAVINGDWQAAWDEFSGYFGGILDGIISFATRWGGRLLSWLAGLVGDAVGWFVDLNKRALENVKSMLNDIISDFKSWGRDLLDEIRDAVDDAVSKITDFTEGFKNAGKGLIDALIGGITDKAEELKGTVEDTLKPLTDLWPASDAKEGPLANLTTFGAAVPETFAKGMERNKQPMIEAADALGKAGMPSPKARGAARRRKTGGKTTIYNVDVSVPEGVNVDTAARTFTDELKSQNWN